ncbi:hypothetical protein Fuma_02792 [Fuerstiella marisgermanici]|uniref:Uncharacterized protein n=1 Tax=Fuerstiella marisgermanici TaxID=1891926 RepID=A0A1P8WGK1_9PLAN|nr:hypothetical protein Fuma_02792 [Fuerstiella marisgermanici]
MCLCRSIGNIRNILRKNVAGSTSGSLPNLVIQLIFMKLPTRPSTEGLTTKRLFRFTWHPRNELDHFLQFLQRTHFNNL